MKREEDAVAALILASGSPTRRRMLTAAGLPFVAISPGVDEAKIKQAMAREQAPPDAVARALAEEKARNVSRQHPDALVIGADLVLVCEGRLFDKANDVNEARANLKALSGRAHELICAAVVARGDATMWQHVERPCLHMRSLDAGDIDRYLTQAGDEVLDSVGGYHLEGAGAQLFERVEGDFFSILGLPLLPLLAFLRQHDIVPG